MRFFYGKVKGITVKELRERIREAKARGEDVIKVGEKEVKIDEI